MVERMNGLTKENTTKRNRYETGEQMLGDLPGWFVRYYFCRTISAVRTDGSGARPSMKPSYSGMPSSQSYSSRSLSRFWLFVHNLLTLDTFCPTGRYSVMDASSGMVMARFYPNGPGVVMSAVCHVSH